MAMDRTLSLAAATISEVDIEKNRLAEGAGTCDPSQLESLRELFLLLDEWDRKRVSNAN